MRIFRFKEVSAVMLLVATMMLFASTLVPHHHHHGVPCMAKVHCVENCSTNNASDHHHNHGDDGCKGGNCVGEENFFSAADRRDAGDDAQPQCLDVLPAMICCMHTMCDHVAHSVTVYYTPYLFADCSALLTAPCGLRAPPVA